MGKYHIYCKCGYECFSNDHMQSHQCPDCGNMTNIAFDDVDIPDEPIPFNANLPVASVENHMVDEQFFIRRTSELTKEICNLVTQLTNLSLAIAGKNNEV